MLKAATSSDTKAKISSAVVKKPRNSPSISASFSAVRSAPVMASMPPGSDAARVDATSSSCDDAVGGRHDHAGRRGPSLPSRSRCASAVSKATNVVPPMLSSSPKVAMPTTVAVDRGRARAR